MGPKHFLHGAPRPTGQGARAARALETTNEPLRLGAPVCPEKE